MDLPRLIASLERFAAVLPATVAGLGTEDARWRPGEGQWSIVEIVGHLVDEETDDFRVRFEHTLHDPKSPWPPIDPEEAVREGGHQDRPLAELLDAFGHERRESIARLRRLHEPAWNLTYEHPILGDLRAGDLLLSWATHDTLHLRQITARLHALIQRAAPEFNSGYAGPWSS